MKIKIWWIYDFSRFFFLVVVAEIGDSVHKSLENESENHQNSMSEFTMG